TQQVKPLLEKLELKTFLQQITQLQQQLGGQVAPAVSSVSSQQLSLFDSPEILVKSEPDSVLLLMQDLPIIPQIIDTKEKLNELVSLLKMQVNQEQPVSWDTETTDLDPRRAKLIGIGCCWGFDSHDLAYIPLGHLQGNQLNKEEVLAALRPILESDRHPKVLQNAKFDRAILYHQGIQLAGVIFDTMLASYVLHPELSHNLSDLCDRYLSGVRSISYKELGIAKGKTIADLDIAIAANYCGLDVYGTFHLVPHLKAELAKNPSLEKLLVEVELPLEPVLAAMEERGIRIDTAYLQQFSQQLEKDLETIKKSAYTEVGEEFNLDSPKQLAVILFEKLGLNRQKSRQTKTG
ncbi:MAG: DNA polymerase, partial [Snowella sp.]